MSEAEFMGAREIITEYNTAMVRLLGEPDKVERGRRLYLRARVTEAEPEWRDQGDVLNVEGLKREFGFTPKLVKLLGEPDRLATNPLFKSARPTRLYRRSRVLWFLEAHLDEVLAARERSESAKVGAATRALKAEAKRRAARAAAGLPVDGEEWARQAEIVLRPFPSDPLWAAHCHFVRREMERYPWGGGYTLECGVNGAGLLAYLRHQRTNYDELLQIFSRFYSNDRSLYRIIRDRVDQAVREVCMQDEDLREVLEDTPECESTE